jgi:hypothetical protein
MPAALVLASLLGAWPPSASPSLLLIVQEQVRPGRQTEYDRNETRIREVCSRWGCPNAYIALTEADAPAKVWWLTAWGSQAEIDEVGRRYAANRTLAARMAPLNAVKRTLASAPTTLLSRSMGGPPLSLAGVRFLSVSPVESGTAPGALYELPGGRRIAIQAFRTRPAASPGATLLVVTPRWSLPPPDVARADPAFWSGRLR